MSGKYQNGTGHRGVAASNLIKGEVQNSMTGLLNTGTLGAISAGNLLAGRETSSSAQCSQKTDAECGERIETCEMCGGPYLFQGSFYGRYQLITFCQHVVSQWSR